MYSAVVPENIKVQSRHSTWDLNSANTLKRQHTKDRPLETVIRQNTTKYIRPYTLDSLSDTIPNITPDSIPDNVLDCTPDSLPDTIPNTTPDSIPDNVLDCTPDSLKTD